MCNKRLVHWVGMGLTCLGAVALGGCGGDDKEAPGDGKPTDAASAAARIEPKSGSTLKGTADFRQAKKMVTLEVVLEGATAGQHAIHIHEIGDCSAPDATSAGEHWNPMNMEHGRWGGESYHLGDIGNLTVDASGKGTLMFTTDEWAIGTGGANDVVGKAIVVHAKQDDFTTQPGGNAGDRIGCGVIMMKLK